MDPSPPFGIEAYVLYLSWSRWNLITYWKNINLVPLPGLAVFQRENNWSWKAPSGMCNAFHTWQQIATMNPYKVSPIHSFAITNCMTSNFIINTWLNSLQWLNNWRQFDFEALWKTAPSFLNDIHHIQPNTCHMTPNPTNHVPGDTTFNQSYDK